MCNSPICNRSYIVSNELYARPPILLDVIRTQFDVYYAWSFNEKRYGLRYRYGNVMLIRPNKPLKLKYHCGTYFCFYNAYHIFCPTIKYSLLKCHYIINKYGSYLNVKIKIFRATVVSYNNIIYKMPRTYFWK